MTRDKFLQAMLEKGKISQAQMDKIKAKGAAKEKYQKDKDKMSAVEMQAMLDLLFN